MPSYFSLKIRTNITIIFELGHQSALSPRETSPPKYEKRAFSCRLERILCFFEKLRRPAMKPGPRSYLLLPLLQLLCPTRRRTFSGNRVNPCRRPDRLAPDKSSPQEKTGLQIRFATRFSCFAEREGSEPFPKSAVYQSVVKQSFFQYTE